MSRKANQTVQITRRRNPKGDARRDCFLGNQWIAYMDVRHGSEKSKVENMCIL